MSKFLNNDVFMFLKIVFVLAKPDEIPPYVAFNLGLYCLSKYLFTGMQNDNHHFRLGLY